jgi:hypothetical protein
MDAGTRETLTNNDVGDSLAMKLSFPTIFPLHLPVGTSLLLPPTFPLRQTSDGYCREGKRLLHLLHASAPFLSPQSAIWLWFLKNKFTYSLQAVLGWHQGRWLDEMIGSNIQADRLFVDKTPRLFFCTTELSTRLIGALVSRKQKLKWKRSPK